MKAAAKTNQAMQLMELPAGRKAVIRRLEGGRPVLSRLAAMGFTPGASISVIRNSDHGPLLVSLRGSRVALGQGEAAHIFVSLAGKEKPVETETTSPATITIALTGQPNVGKSSVFNVLTGLNQHVGNWTGKTIECKVGTFKFKGTEFSIVDLPGTYSLTASFGRGTPGAGLYPQGTSEPDRGGGQCGHPGTQPVPGGRTVCCCRCRSWLRLT